MTNPILENSPLPLGLPDWGAITPSDIIPALDEAIAVQREAWEKIATNPEPPTIENTIDALEDSGRLLNRAASIAYTFTSSIGGPQYESIEAEVEQKLTAHFNAYYLDKRIYRRIKALDVSHAPEYVRTWVDDELKHFRLSGIELSDEDAHTLMSLDSQIAAAQVEFNHRVIKAMSDNALVIADVSELEGAAPAQLHQWKQSDGTFRVPLENYTMQAALAQLANPQTRRKLLAASLRRGFGDHESSDTRSLVLQIVRLRAQRAQLLGFSSHAELVAQREAAGSSQAIMDLLTKVADRAMAAVTKQKSTLEAMAAADGVDFEVADWPYYQEKLRAQIGLDNDALAPYFELNATVENGVFFAANRLYGLTFHERTDLAGYVPRMRTWEVRDESGTTIALFQADYVTREGKSGGAWMDEVQMGSERDGTLPIIHNNMNFPEPKNGEPLLLTWDNVTTLFHEFGHALHGILGRTYYRSQAGTSVPRDVVEMPSQLNEIWASHPEVIAHYARHYQTGEPLPQHLIDAIVASQHIGQAYDTAELVASMLLDQAWHRLAPEDVPDDVEAFERETLARFGIDFVPPRYRSTYFAHTFGGGYDAGYYSYMWADVLVGELEEWWHAQDRDSDGGFRREVGQEYAEKLLSRGSTRPFMTSFKAVVGHEPSADAMIRLRGLAD
ncbi:MAG: M3 family metallopeptidase [Actinomycetaceae bacterium]|nr:M3 family metallopeptidase [Actinomycetaceae bacterium]MDY6083126.1 M3 family metallopeptidase [Actinomycetaceae bacterium]